MTPTRWYFWNIFFSFFLWYIRYVFQFLLKLELLSVDQYVALNAYSLKYGKEVVLTLIRLVLFVFTFEYNCFKELLDLNQIYLFCLFSDLTNVFLFLCIYLYLGHFLIHLQLLWKVAPSLFRYFLSFLHHCPDFWSVYTCNTCCVNFGSYIMRIIETLTFLAWEMRNSSFISTK